MFQGIDARVQMNVCLRLCCSFGTSSYIRSPLLEYWMEFAKPPGVLSLGRAKGWRDEVFFVSFKPAKFTRQYFPKRGTPGIMGWSLGMVTDGAECSRLRSWPTILSAHNQYCILLYYKSSKPPLDLSSRLYPCSPWISARDTAKGVLSKQALQQTKTPLSSSLWPYCTFSRGPTLPNDPPARLIV